jgi:spermidine/putrescine transport system substrate-binding protein
LNEPSNPGLTRRTLLGRAGTVAASAATAAAIAGCENTTTPVAVGGTTNDGNGLFGDPTAGGPVDAVGIPLSRRDYPVTLPRIGHPVASSVKPERGGELKIFNYADYINPAVIKAFGKQEGVTVTVTTFNSLDEAFSKLTTGLQFDVLNTTPDQLAKWVGRKIVQPLNLELIPNLQKNVWSELHSPCYDVGSRYTIPYTVYTTGIGWRNDRIDFDPSKLDQPWDAFWKATKYQGRVGILDDNREALGMAMMRRGITNLNAEDPALISKATDDLRELNQLVRVKVDITEYETLPSARTWLHQSWSGDMINAVIAYLPKGTKPDVLSYWYQQAGGPVFNDCWAVAAKATKPVLAHRFLNYMLDNKVAYENFAGFLGYQPPITAISPNVLFEKGLLPKSLSTVPVTEEAYANGNAYLAMTSAGETLWDKAWSTFKNG